MTGVQTCALPISSTDAEDPTANLTFLWDLDGDGVFGESGPDAQRGNELSATPFFTAAGLSGGFTLTVSLRVVDTAGAMNEAQTTIDVLPVTTANLQATLPQNPAGGNFLFFSVTTEQEANAIVAAVNGLPVPAYPVDIGVDLGGGDFFGVTVSPPPNVTLTLFNGTFNGASPALTVTSGTVILVQSTLRNTTNAATVLVTGGHLIIRQSTIEESPGYSQAAVHIIGGSVDLGTAADPGGNTIIVHGAGELIRNGGPVAEIGRAHV